MGVVANVAINLDARGVQQQLKAIRQTSVGAADGFKKLGDRAKAVKAIVEAQQGGFAKASTVQGVFAAKVRNTEQAIKAQISALRDVQSKVQLGGALYQKAAKQIADYERVLRQANQTQEQNARSGTRLGGVIRGLVGVYAASRTIQFVFGQAAEIEKQTRSLEVLVGSAEKARDIVKQLQDIGAVTPFTSTELIESAKRLQAFGVDTEKVVETTRRLADVSGATGAELQGLVTAYGQVQAKGRLQGEELLQFQERGVALQKVLKEEYKLSGDEFQKALSKGQISAEAVEYAVRKLTDAGGKYANGAIAQSDTLAGKLSTLQDSFQRLAQNIGKFFEPVFKFLIEGITRFINRLNDATVMQDEIRARNQAIDEAREKFGRFNVFAAGRGEFIARREKEIFGELRAGRSTAAPKAPTITADGPPALLGGTNGGGTSKPGATAAEQEAAKLLASQQLLDVLGLQLKIAQEENPIKAIGLELELQKLQINQEYEKILASETNEQIRQNAEKAKNLKLEKAIVAAKGKSKDLGEQIGHDLARMFLQQSQQTKQLTDQEKLYNSIYQVVANNLTQAIQGLIQGTSTLNDLASQLLSQLGSLFLNAGFGMLGKALKIPGMAGGGGVSGGSPYLVGERGPELFVPGANGGVMSNSDLRSAMNAAPGASGSPVLNMSFETTNIAGVEYVSRDQLEAAMAATRRSATRDGAKQGMSMTLDRLQQSPQVRSRVGLR